MRGETVWALSLATGMGGALVGVVVFLLTKVEERLGRIEEALVRIDGRLTSVETRR